MYITVDFFYCVFWPHEAAIQRLTKSLWSQQNHTLTNTKWASEMIEWQMCGKEATKLEGNACCRADNGSSRWQEWMCNLMVSSVYVFCHCHDSEIQLLMKLADCSKPLVVAVVQNLGQMQDVESWHTRSLGRSTLCSYSSWVVVCSSLWTGVLVEGEAWCDPWVALETMPHITPPT